MLSGTILVVEDHADTSEGLVRLLRHQGHQAEAVDSGEHAIEWLTTRVPDLIILDMMMPGTDGLDVLRLIRAEPRLAKVPVILYSVISDLQFREYAMREGATAYWEKGAIDYRHLPQMLAQYLPALLPG